LSARLKNALGSLIAVYFFVGIVVIKSAAVIMGESLAEKVVLLIRDTTSGVFAGWLGTAILQSSGAFDSIIVVFTSSGVMPLTLAVATIIGAEIGTTVTPFLISVLGHVRKGKRLTASFGVFSKIATQGSTIFLEASWLQAFPDIIDVATPWVDALVEMIPPWMGLLP
jgi:Na+/phosphate symporter